MALRNRAVNIVSTHFINQSLCCSLFSTSGISTRERNGGLRDRMSVGNRLNTLLEFKSLVRVICRIFVLFSSLCTLSMLSISILDRTMVFPSKEKPLEIERCFSLSERSFIFPPAPNYICLALFCLTVNTSQPSILACCNFFFIEKLFNRE